MKEIELSDNQISIVLKAVFRNLWGRMHPESAYARYGPGLFVGKKSANYKFIRSIWVLFEKLQNRSN